MLHRTFSILVSAFSWPWLQFSPPRTAQIRPDFDVKEHYTKYEYRIAMRDGAHLFTPSTFRKTLPDLTHS